jgi:hypothetical protein
MSSAGSARSFFGSVAARGRRLAAVTVGELCSAVQRGVRILSAGRNTGSGADSVDAVEVVGSALIFWPGSGSVS